MYLKAALMKPEMLWRQSSLTAKIPQGFLATPSAPRSATLLLVVTHLNSYRTFITTFIRQNYCSGKYSELTTRPATSSCKQSISSTPNRRTNLWFDMLLTWRILPADSCDKPLSGVGNILTKNIRSVNFSCQDVMGMTTRRAINCKIFVLMTTAGRVCCISWPSVGLRSTSQISPRWGLIIASNYPNLHYLKQRILSMWDRYRNLRPSPTDKEK